MRLQFVAQVSAGSSALALALAALQAQMLQVGARVEQVRTAHTQSCSRLNCVSGHVSA